MEAGALQPPDAASQRVIHADVHASWDTGCVRDPERRPLTRTETALSLAVVHLSHTKQGTV